MCLWALVEGVAAAAVVTGVGVDGVGSVGATGVAALLFDATSTGVSVDGVVDGDIGCCAATAVGCVLDEL